MHRSAEARWPDTDALGSLLLRLHLGDLALDAGEHLLPLTETGLDVSLVAGQLFDQA